MQTGHSLSVVTCLIGLRFPSEELENGMCLLMSLIGRTESKPGCQSCTITHHAEERERVQYKEVWDSEVLFLKHAQTEEFRRVLIAMEMCDEEPIVEIGNFSGQTGFEHLRELCS